MLDNMRMEGMPKEILNPLVDAAKQTACIEIGIKKGKKISGINGDTFHMTHLT